MDKKMLKPKMKYSFSMMWLLMVAMVMLDITCANAGPVTMEFRQPSSPTFSHTRAIIEATTNATDSAFQRAAAKRIEVDANVTNAFQVRFLIKPSFGCAEDQFLMIIVCSATENAEQRQAIRTTWGHTLNRNSRSSASKVLFLLGATPTRESQSKVETEHQLYGDIIQVDFIDSYGNLTLKSISLLHWISTHCSSVMYVLKTDDDMFVNVPLLLKDLQNTIHKRFIMGDIIAGAQPMVERDSKWFTPKKMFPGKMYPKYVSGSAYVISGDAIQDLITATSQIPLFWIEDIYITGFCAQTMNIDLIYSSHFNYRRRLPDPCFFRTTITGHRLTSFELKSLWKSLQDTSLLC